MRAFKHMQTFVAKDFLVNVQKTFQVQTQFFNGQKQPPEVFCKNRGS